MNKIIGWGFVFISLFSCQSIQHKDVVYGQSSNNKNLKLNIFVPKNPAKKKLPILIFVHGGNWNSGNKNTYGFFGRNFAKKGVLTIIPEYTLSPKADVAEMTTEIANAIKWVQQNIENYQGDAQQIFVTGHSAGGQLAASAVLNPKFGIGENAVAGIILNDAAGIDMKNYLEKNPPTTEDDYLKTWSNNPENWYQASPIYFIDENSPPFLIYVGTKTYASIKAANKNFLTKLNEFQPKVKPIFLPKNHVSMILQYFWSGNNRYREIINFIDENKK